MSGIFLSYRRDDSAGFAGRLADALEQAFGIGSVFRDVDDIRPGEDFVTTIQDRLAEVDVVLVMIGPRWLGAAAEGRRRLDDPEDFVRREIEAALASRRKLIPVLVGGATMPAETDLPQALAGLARHQAVVLADADWRGDVARLTEALQPHLAQPGRRRRGLALGLAALALVLAAGIWSVFRFGLGEASPGAADVAGRWSAEVKYEWGDRHKETFEFRDQGGRVAGTATYLTGRLGIEAASLEGDWLRFETRSQEQLGSDQPWKEVVHRYAGQITPTGIRFTLQSGGGYSVHPPIEFIAQRVPDPKP